MFPPSAHPSPSLFFITTYIHTHLVKASFFAYYHPVGRVAPLHAFQGASLGRLTRMEPMKRGTTLSSMTCSCLHMNSKSQEPGVESPGMGKGACKLKRMSPPPPRFSPPEFAQPGSGQRSRVNTPQRGKNDEQHLRRKRGFLVREWSVSGNNTPPFLYSTWISPVSELQSPSFPAPSSLEPLRFLRRT